MNSCTYPWLGKFFNVIYIHPSTNVSGMNIIKSVIINVNSVWRTTPKVILFVHRAFCPSSIARFCPMIAIELGQPHLLIYEAKCI